MGKGGGDPGPDDDRAASQARTHYRFDGKLYPWLPYGSETFGAPAPVGRRPCRHCGAVRGQLHEPLCDYEQCPVCGEQVMSCDCGIYTENAVPGP
jgi:hypothetical protein